MKELLSLSHLWQILPLLFHYTSFTVHAHSMCMVNFAANGDKSEFQDFKDLQCIVASVLINSMASR